MRQSKVKSKAVKPEVRPAELERPAPGPADKLPTVDDVQDLLELAETDADLEYIDTLLVQIGNGSGAPAGAPPAEPKTDAEFAAAIGVSDRTIRRYWKRGAPRDSLAALIAWRDLNIAAIAADGEPGELQLEKLRSGIIKDREAARTQKLKNDALQGTLISRDEVATDISLWLTRFSSRLRSLGMDISSLAPAELKAPIKAMADDRVRVAFKELTEGNPVDVC